MSNYSNMVQQLSSITRQDTTPQFSDIENFNKEFLKQTLQGVGSMGVGAQATTALKVLKTQLKGPVLDKLGIKPEELDEIQSSLEQGDLNSAVQQLGSKLTGKLTDGGRKLLGGIKDKLTNLQKQSEDLKTSTPDILKPNSDLLPPRTITKDIDMPHPARTQPSESNEIQSSTDENIGDVQDRLTARYNNLDGKAQARSDDTFNSDPLKVDNPENLQDLKTNVRLRQNSLQQEEVNPDTTFKNPDLQVNKADQPEYANQENIFNNAPRTRNPESYDNAPEKIQEISENPDFESTVTAARSAVAKDVASAGSKIEEGTAALGEELGGELATASALDFSPVGWLATLGAGIGVLVAGSRIKAHSQKFRPPPNLTRSYSVQQDL